MRTYASTLPALILALLSGHASAGGQGAALLLSKKTVPAPPASPALVDAIPYYRNDAGDMDSLTLKRIEEMTPVQLKGTIGQIEKTLGKMEAVGVQSADEWATRTQKGLKQMIAELAAERRNVDHVDLNDAADAAAQVAEATKFNVVLQQKTNLLSDWSSSLDQYLRGRK